MMRPDQPHFATLVDVEEEGKNHRSCFRVTADNVLEQRQLKN